jgi:hypothetical protein
MECLKICTIPRVVGQLNAVTSPAEPGAKNGCWQEPAAIQLTHCQRVGEPQLTLHSNKPRTHLLGLIENVLFSYLSHYLCNVSIQDSFPSLRKTPRPTFLQWAQPFKFSNPDSLYISHVPLTCYARSQPSPQFDYGNHVN